MDGRDTLTEKIIGCCYRVHTALGPGFSEKIYHNALKSEFEENGIKFETEKRFDVGYKGRKVGVLVLDLVVESRVVVEIKAVTGVMPVLFRNQVLSYLKASDLRVGLLVNFGNKSCQVKRLSK